MSTHLPMYVFTSQIPTIVISQAGIEPLTVRLMDGQKTLLETTLYPLAGQIKLYDIGRIYEEYLRSLNDEDYYPYIIETLIANGFISPELMHDLHGYQFGDMCNSLSADVKSAWAYLLQDCRARCFTSSAGNRLDSSTSRIW